MIFYVAKTRDLNQVTWEMRIESGVPKFPGSQDLPGFPYAAYARMLGFEGIRVDNPADIGEAWDAVLRADRPALLEAVVDPEMSMLPPHIKPEQAKSFAMSALRGDPEEGPMIVQSVKSILAGMIPHRHGAEDEAHRH